MRNLVLILCFAAFTVPAQAQEKKAPSEKQKAQQQKMKACNKQAVDKKMKGDDRKKFMSSCLSG